MNDLSGSIEPAAAPILFHATVVRTRYQRPRIQRRPTVEVRGLPPANQSAPSLFWNAGRQRRSPSAWYLFPDRANCSLPLSTYLFHLDSSVGGTYSTLNQIWKQQLPFQFGLPTVLTTQQKIDFARLTSMIERNIRFRWNMKRLIGAWILRRLCKLGNKEDPCTLEPPVTPIRVVDWSQRRIYQFEARSILHDIRTRLLLNDGLFHEPKPPRNPFTNLPLTSLQLYSIHQQARRARVSDWVLEGLADQGYKVCKFVKKYEGALKQEMLQKLFRHEYTSNAMIEIQLDFIIEHHDICNKDCNEAVYLWGLKHSPEMAPLKQWRTLCYRQWLSYMTCHDSDEYLQVIAYIREKAIPLCEPPRELFVARKQWRLEPLQSCGA